MTDHEDDSRELNAATAVDLLRANGPMDEDEWIDLLAEAGYEVDHAEELVLDNADDSVVDFPDGRVAVIDEARDRTVLTRRLTAEEIAADILDVLPDLDPLVPDSSDPRVVFPGFHGIPALSARDDDPIFAERGAQSLAERIDYGLALPCGTLEGCRPGDLVAVRAGGDDLVTVSPCPEPEDVDLAAVLAEAVPRDRPAMYKPIVWELMWSGEYFRTATLPLSELAENAGYVIDKDEIAAAGFDFVSYRRTRGLTLLATQYGITVEDAAAIDAVSNIAAASMEEHDALVRNALADDSAVFHPLQEFAIAQVAVEYVDDHALLFDRAASSGTPQAGPESAHIYLRLASAADAIARLAAVRVRAGALHISTMAALRMGDPVRAEELLRRALDTDPEWLPATRLLASLAVIRSDLDGARALMSRFPDDGTDPLNILLGELASTAHAEPGRNDPCWCGSGRKYKKCHRGKLALAPSQRGRLLQEKAFEFIRLSQFSDLPVHLDEVRTAGLSGASARALAGDPLASDVALIEGGLLAMFVRMMGPILPEDDQLLAAQWLLAGRSVFDVEAVRPGEGMTLRDLRTGDRFDVTERLASREVAQGSYICSRVVPEGDTHVLYGGIEPIDQGRRGALIELLDSADDDAPADPSELVEFLSARFAPPRLVAAGVVCEHERKWPDQKLPALGGYTPREAVADPTRRDDVVRLLDSFPAANGPGEMDPHRLRDELGL